MAKSFKPTRIGTTAMTNEYLVTYKKTIVNGPLKGVVVEGKVHYPTRETAEKHATWAKAHAKKAVQAIGGGNYTCQDVRVETIRSR